MKMTAMMILAKLLELSKDLLHQTGYDDDGEGDCDDYHGVGEDEDGADEDEDGVDEDEDDGAG